MANIELFTWGILLFVSGYYVSNRKQQHCWSQWGDPFVIEQRHHGSFSNTYIKYQTVQSRTCAITKEVQTRVAADGKVESTPND